MGAQTSHGELSVLRKRSCPHMLRQVHCPQLPLWLRLVLRVDTCCLVRLSVLLAGPLRQTGQACLVLLSTRASWCVTSSVPYVSRRHTVLSVNSGSHRNPTAGSGLVHHCDQVGSSGTRSQCLPPRQEPWDQASRHPAEVISNTCVWALSCRETLGHSFPFPRSRRWHSSHKAHHC